MDLEPAERGRFAATLIGGEAAALLSLLLGGALFVPFLAALAGSAAGALAFARLGR